MTKYKILHLPTGTYLYYTTDGLETSTLYSQYEIDIRIKNCGWIATQYSCIFNTIAKAKDYIEYSITHNPFSFEPSNGTETQLKKLFLHHVEIIEVLDD